MGVDPPAVRSRLGAYEVGERLGAGGMAEVFVARRRGVGGFQKRFALKRILPQLAADSRFVAMFCDEACILALLQHPNIVQIVDFGEDAGELFMALEYVDGLSVARLLRQVAARRQRVPVGAALFIAREVLRALTFAHGAVDELGRPLHVVHRDVSPGNILLSRSGEVKLTDFGIVRSTFVDRRTYPGELKGKLGYMAPEQVVAAEVDARSDLFSLGVVLAELLLTRPLFPGRTELEVLTKIHRADLSVLYRHGADLPRELQLLLQQALSVTPGGRFDSAAAFLAALEGVAARLGRSLSEAQVGPWASALGLFASSSGVLPVGPLPQRGAPSSVALQEAPTSHGDLEPDTLMDPVTLRDSRPPRTA